MKADQAKIMHVARQQKAVAVYQQKRGLKSMLQYFALLKSEVGQTKPFLNI